MEVFYFPIENAGLKISQKFGLRPVVYRKFGLKGHNGLDFACPVGTTLLAIGDGIVTKTEDEGKTGYGKYIQIQHKNHYSVLAHLSDFLVKVGDSVRTLQKIALSGNTGFSSGPHTHLTLKATDKDGKVLNYGNGYKGAINPYPFLLAHHFGVPFEADLMDKKLIQKRKRLDDYVPRGELYVILSRLLKQ